MRINYRRISLRHSLSRECSKMVKFASITHSERNIWNCPIVATAISRIKLKPVLEGNGCLTERSWCVLATPVTRPVRFHQGHCLRPTTSKRKTRIAYSASTQQLGTSHKACVRGFGGNGSIAWTSAVSHMGRTSNAFKVTMKLQTFLFQMVVTSCISVQYL